MARFFVPEHAVELNRVTITGPDVKHIARVLRLGPGQVIDISTGHGKEFSARISEINKQEVVCQIIMEKTLNTEPPIKINLYQGIPKGDKMEFVIQKSTELGITRIIPVICERTVVKLDDKKVSGRRLRWERVAEEAAKQSRRTAIPEVSEPLTFSNAVQQVSGEVLGLMPWEEHKTGGIRHLLRDEPVKAREIAVFVGPEGGFSAGEAELAKSQGIHLVTLGPRIMRTETAGIVVVAILLYELGDLGGGDHR